MIDRYVAHTPLELLERRRDDHGFGAWLGHADNPDAPFILVFAQFLPAPIGYICLVNDPDGNTVEFSHDQGIYAFAQKHFART